MFKRLLLVAAGAFLLGQALVLSVQFVQGRSFFPSNEASRRSDQFRQVLHLINEHYVREDEAT